MSVNNVSMWHYVGIKFCNGNDVFFRGNFTHSRCFGVFQIMYCLVMLVYSSAPVDRIIKNSDLVNTDLFSVSLPWSYTEVWNR